MLIGVPKEVKTHEYRVGLVPGSVRELVHHGHKVVVESGAGAAIGFDDQAYEAAVPASCRARRTCSPSPSVWASIASRLASRSSS